MSKETTIKLLASLGTKLLVVGILYFFVGGTAALSFSLGLLLAALDARR